MAALAYNTVARVISVAYSQLYVLPRIAFYDDFAGVAPEGVQEALAYFKQLNDTVGYLLREHKCATGKKIQYLGTNLDATGRIATLSLPEEKRHSYKEQIDRRLLEQKRSATTAETLVGRLQFCESSIYARASRVKLQNLHDHQHSKSGLL